MVLSHSPFLLREKFHYEFNAYAYIIRRNIFEYTLEKIKYLNKLSNEVPTFLIILHAYKVCGKLVDCVQLLVLHIIWATHRSYCTMQINHCQGVFHSESVIPTSSCIERSNLYLLNLFLQYQCLKGILLHSDTGVYRRLLELTTPHI